MIEPPRISLASLPTPLQLLERLSEELGVRIWLKRDDLTDSVATGNKIRKLEYTIGQALAESADVLVTWGGVQSNHCRTTAALAARLGLKAHLLLRGSQPGGNCSSPEFRTAVCARAPCTNCRSRPGNSTQ